MRLRTLALTAGLLWPVSVSSQQARFFATGNSFLLRWCRYISKPLQRICGWRARHGSGVPGNWGDEDQEVKQIVMQYPYCFIRRLGATGEVIQALQNAFPCVEQAR